MLSPLWESSSTRVSSPRPDALSPSSRDPPISSISLLSYTGIVKFQPMDEELKLNFIKEIGFCHMRILDGLDSLLQLSGLIGKLCCNAGVVRK